MALYELNLSLKTDRFARFKRFLQIAKVLFLAGFVEPRS